MTGFAPIQQFVRQHRLHGSIPVDLAPFSNVYDIRLVDFSSSTLGFCYSGKRHTVVGINAHLHPYVQRAVLCHEVAHHLLGHPNSLYLCSFSEWWYQRLEVRAQKGAAIMLVPTKSLRAIVLGGWSMAEAEDHLEVPAELIRLRLNMIGLAV